MQFSAAIGGIANEAGWPVRAYGEKLEDLAIDPLDGPLPVAAAQVLSACVGDNAQAAADIMVWPVNMRLQGLLAVTIASFGAKWTWSARCTAPGCGAAMDLPLDLRDFLFADALERVECKLDDGRGLSIAVPTGRDQLDWLGEKVLAKGEMLRRLLPDDMAGEKLGPRDEKIIELALEQVDPLRTLEIETDCPECRTAVTLPLDLEAICLSRLAELRPRLLDEVHLIAKAYHWSESDIMAVPPARRAAYLARIEGLAP